jgi:hypothetical protein
MLKDEWLLYEEEEKGDERKVLDKGRKKGQFWVDGVRKVNSG